MKNNSPHDEKSISRRSFAKGALLGASSVCLGGHLRGAPLTSQRPELSSINPLIGASTSKALGEGKTFPGPTTPFGMVQLSPDTITGGDNAPGYSYEHTTIEGFSFTHMSGVGWYGDFGNLLVMPTTGPMKLACGRVDRPGEGWRSKFRHETEKAELNYYAVDLDDYRIRTELAAAPRAGMLQFTFPQSDASRVQFNFARRIGGTSTRQYVKVAGPNAIEGWMACPSSGGGWGNGDGQVSYTLYFRAEFSKPLTKFGVWSIDVPETAFQQFKGLISDYFRSDDFYGRASRGQVLDVCHEKEGNHLGFFAEFATHDAEQIQVKAGISYVSLVGARRNLLHDIPGWNFGDVRQSGIERWNVALGAVRVEGGSAKQNAVFATALYHAMIDPRAISDIDGAYTGADNQTHIARNYTHRTIFSGWDVFRGEFPLMTILNPQLINDEINSLVELAELSGKGYLERWEIMNAYSGCMDGDPATSVIVDAYNKGIRKFDIEKAYAACRQTAAGTEGKTNRPANEFYMECGWVPGQVSWTLDNCYYDWCVANFAAALGKNDDARLFSARARNYKKIFDPSVQSMRAKDENGEWIPWKGKTAFGQGCTESNPLQQTWFVPHDVFGLIDMMGGKEEFSRLLEEFFEKTPPSFGWNDYYNHSNEPVHHIAYLFAYAGKPWLTQKWVRNILMQAYHDDVNGICGNDDVGQMSAWYVLSALGFYPVCPGDNIYIIGSPLFLRAVLHLDREWYSGGSFTITAANQAPEHPYIQSAKLNGESLSRSWIRHSEIIHGGELALVMGAEPNLHWATGHDDLPPSGTKW
jgi:predicted alpha-1,2-mannosidase